MAKDLTGKVKFFDRTKGFGFIKEDGTDIDYFFHRSRQLNIDEVLNAGDFVRFDEGKNRNGTCAINVERT